MAARRGSSGGGRSTPSARGRSGANRPSPKASRTPPKAAAPAAEIPRPHPGPFRLGAVAGTTPGKWIDAWHQRMPATPLELVALEPAGQRDALTSSTVDAALVRLPLDRDGLHIIALYDEVPVVVCAADSHLTAADELTLDDLAGEVVIVPRDAVIEVPVPGAVRAAFAAPETTEEAIATVAAGVGVVIVPMSLARLHHRKDADYRPLVDGPTSTVALAWPQETSSRPGAESDGGGAAALVDTFVGIVRGRTANSSRG